MFQTEALLRRLNIWGSTLLIRSVIYTSLSDNEMHFSSTSWLYLISFDSTFTYSFGIVCIYCTYITVHLKFSTMRQFTMKNCCSRGFMYILFDRLVKRYRTIISTPRKILHFFPFALLIWEIFICLDIWSDSCSMRFVKNRARLFDLARQISIRIIILR